MKKILFLLPLLANVVYGQVVISNPNNSTNLVVHSSVGLEARSSNQAAAFPEYFITDLTIHPYTKVPKNGTIVFSPNRNTSTGDETYYGYFYWENTRWVKLLDSENFSKKYDYNVPYFFSNFNQTNQTSKGVVFSSSIGESTNTTPSNLSSTITDSKHEIGFDLANNSGYWTIATNFVNNFVFKNQSDGFVEVNAIIVKPGANIYHFDIAMAIFMDDKLIGTKIIPFASSTYTGCIRRKMALSAPISSVSANVSHNIKLGFRVIGNSYFDKQTGFTTSQVNYNLNTSKFYVGTAFTNDLANSDNNYTGCTNTSLQSPITVTVYGVTN